MDARTFPAHVLPSMLPKAYQGDHRIGNAEPTRDWRQLALFVKCEYGMFGALFIFVTLP